MRLEFKWFDEVDNLRLLAARQARKPFPEGVKPKVWDFLVTRGDGVMFRLHPRWSNKKMDATEWEGLSWPFVGREKINVWKMRAYPLQAHGVEQAGVEPSPAEERFAEQRAERQRAQRAEKKAAAPAAASSSAAAPSPAMAQAQAAAAASPYAVAEPYYSPGPPTSETVVMFQGYECHWCGWTQRWVYNVSGEWVFWD